MRTPWLRGVVAGLVLSWPHAALSLSLARPTNDAESAPDEILVDLRDDASDAAVRLFRQRHGLPGLALNSPQADDENLYVAKVSAELQADLLWRLQHDPLVEYAEPNWIYRLIDAEEGAARRLDDAPSRKLPGQVNDPHFSKQWSFAMVSVTEAWAHADGAGVIVAVIDTGVAFEDHRQFRRVEDLGQTSFVEGYDFIKDDAHPNDDHGHGTHVAARSRRVRTTASASPASRRGLPSCRSRSSPSEAQGRQVTLRTRSDSPPTKARTSSTFRWAAGRARSSWSRRSGTRETRGCSSSARRERRTRAGRISGRVPWFLRGQLRRARSKPRLLLEFRKSDCGHGAGGNKNLGPGSGILQNTITPFAVDAVNQYLEFQGTSMAAPHVAGIAALVMSTGLRDVEAVEAVLKQTATDLGPRGWDERFGHGLVDAKRAVEMAMERRDSSQSLFASGGLLSLSLLLSLFGGFARRAAGPAKVVAGALGAFGFVSLPFEFVRSAMILSSLPVLGLTLAFLHLRQLRPALFGLALGWTVALVLQGVLLTSNVLGDPWGRGPLRSGLGARERGRPDLAHLAARSNVSRLRSSMIDQPDRVVELAALLAPIGISPFFALAGIGWAAERGHIHLPAGLELLAEPLVFGCLLVFAVLLQVGKSSKLTRPLAEGLGTGEGLIAILIAFLMFVAEGLSPPSTVTEASLASGLVLGVAATFAVAMILALRVLFDVFIWLSPVPFIDMAFEMSKTLTTLGLVALVAWAPGVALAAFLTIVLLAPSRAGEGRLRAGRMALTVLWDNTLGHLGPEMTQASRSSPSSIACPASRATRRVASASRRAPGSSSRSSGASAASSSEGTIHAAFSDDGPASFSSSPAAASCSRRGMVVRKPGCEASSSERRSRMNARPQ
ncbi:MAG: S8 family serine peptidase [Myxococcales bacterium]|nr:S8 family serine peptidase [Myxococcales bacterium]